VRSLILYTKLPEIYSFYTQLLSFSSVSESGYDISSIFSFMEYIDFTDYPVKIFFQVISNFLEATNKKFRALIKKK
jgi:hypothetical protein